MNKSQVIFIKITIYIMFLAIIGSLLEYLWGYKTAVIISITTLWCTIYFYLIK